MQTSIQSFIHTPSGIRDITLFGYTTRGIPGLEIHGLKKQGKLIKEKIIYLTRKRGLKSPMLRYCLCLDSRDSICEIPAQEMINLEIPFLIMFWHLAGFIPIAKLDDCRASGSFTTRGHFYFNQIDSEPKLIDIGVGECVEASELFENIPDLSFSTKSKSREYLKALKSLA